MSDVSEGAVYLCNNLYTPTNTNYGATACYVQEPVGIVC